MDKEKSEQIKIALLAVIALMLIIKTVNMPTELEVVRSERIPVNSVANSPQTSINNDGGLNITNFNPISGAIPEITTLPASTSAAPSTTMTFDRTNGDLGSIAAGDKKTFTYNMTNTGSTPLTFSSITADPGLIIVTQPSAAIAPGEKGAITVQLTAEAGTGPITKTIHVGSNTQPAHMHLTLTADVK